MQLARLSAVLPLVALAAVPHFPQPSYVFAGDSKDFCGWLELVAYRFRLGTPSASMKLVRAIMTSVPDETMDWLRIGTPLRHQILEKLASETCPPTWAPRPDALAKHPWPQAPSSNINGETDTENHRVLYNNSMVQVVNVHASHQEQFHSHRKLSIFVAWGIDMCQDDHSYDGTVTHLGAADCATTYNATMPKTLQVLFMSTEWLHANVLYKSMDLPQSPNCPHDSAPDRCDGFLTRFVFHDDAPARVYPLDPLRVPTAASLVV